MELSTNERRVKEVVHQLNKTLKADNYIHTFQFVSVDASHARNLSWMLYSLDLEKYNLCVEDFIGTSENSESSMKRTLIYEDYHQPYWEAVLGAAPISISKSSDYEFKTPQDIPIKTKETFVNETPELYHTSSLVDLLGYWKDCLVLRFGHRGYIFWVEQEVKNIDRNYFYSSVFVLFNSELEDLQEKLEVSNRLRNFIIDYIIDIYKDRTLTLHIEKEEEYRKLIDEKNQTIFVSNKLKEKLANDHAKVNSGKPILLTGPKGTGKDFVAQYIHEISSRKDLPFLRFNSNKYASKAEEIEEYLSTNNATGPFGTLFFDDIHELPKSLEEHLIEYFRHKKDYVSNYEDNATSSSMYRIIVGGPNGLYESHVVDGDLSEYLFDLIYRIEYKLCPLSKRSDILDITQLIINDTNSELKDPGIELSKELIDFIKLNGSSFELDANLLEYRMRVGRVCRSVSEEGRALIELKDFEKIQGLLRNAADL